MGKDSWKPLSTNKKQKGLGCFQCVNILRGGVSAQREAEFSKFKERGVESKISCSFWASFKEGGGVVLLRTLCQIPVLGATRLAGAAGTKVQCPMIRGVSKSETVHRSPF